MRNVRSILVIALLLICTTASAAFARDEPRWMIGARSGITYPEKGKNVVGSDLFLQRDLPLRWKIVQGLALGGRGEVSLGALSSRSATGFTAHIGPTVYLEMAELILLHGGVHAGGVSERRFGSRDFGGSFQFFSHGGLSVRIGRQLEAGYRYQHMSNADIYPVNPGLNLHLLEFGYRF